MAALRVGLLAAARIAPRAVVLPAQEIDGVAVVAVAARSIDRAEAFADEWGVPLALGSYEALLGRSDVDAVYVATPPAWHRRWTIAALEAGHHVLCEKPIGANAADAAAMVAAADRTGRVLVEAFHWRYHPLADAVLEVVRSGELGPLVRVEGEFSLPEGTFGPGDNRWDLVLGGGALMDLGCYPVHWCRTVVGEEPAVVSATAVCPTPEVDASMVAELAFPGGVTAEVRASMAAPPGDRVVRLRVTGRDGVLDVVNPLAPQLGHELAVRGPGGERRWQVEATSTFVHQLRAFVAACTGDAPAPTGGADAVATMAAIDAIYEAAGLRPRPSAPLR